MAILRKIRSASLIEALVATVLIVIVFMVASLILNNLLVNSFSKNTHAVENRLYELEYQFTNDAIRLPYKEEFGIWNIELKLQQADNKTWLNSSAVNTANNKEVIKSRICNQQK